MMGYLKVGQDYKIIRDATVSTMIGGKMVQRTWPWVVRITNHDWYEGITGVFYEIDIVKETGNIRFKWHTTAIPNQRIQTKLIESTRFHQHLAQIIGSIMMDCNSLIETGQVDAKKIDHDFQTYMWALKQRGIEKELKESHRGAVKKNVDEIQDAGNLSEKRASEMRREKSSQSSGKGDQQRESQVSEKEVSDNWDKTFNKEGK